MALLLALLCTFSIGTGEHLAAGATKSTRSHEVTSGMFASGTILTAVLALAWPGDPSVRDLVFGALGGAANGVGILLLYYAYSRGSLRSAAPTAGVVMSAVPVLWNLTVGSVPSTVVWAGIALGLTAIGFTSYQPEDGKDDRYTVSIAVVAGVVFGILLILLAEIGPDAGGSPLFVQRLVGLVIAVTVTRLTGPRIFPARRQDRWTSFTVGMFATTAIILFVLAIHAGGNLAVVSVMGSQYPAVAVLLGVLVHRQPLRWWQGVGLALASVAVALITVG
ncbi:MAG: EamA family transporter [Acidimicrobiales bacterium]